MKKVLPLLFSIATLTSLFGQTTVPALISSNQTWTKSGSPYIIGQTTLIEQGVKVLIEPGVKVESNSSSLQSLMVDGELRAIGTKDSIIEIEKISISFSDKSVGYNKATNVGAYFYFCHIEGIGQSNYPLVKLTKTSAKFENCDFRNAYYMIQPSSSSVGNNRIEVDGCTFMNDRAGSKFGYALDAQTAQNIYEIRNSHFEYMRGIRLGGSFTFEKNTVNDLYSIECSPRRSSSIKCNDFVKISQSINLDMKSTDTTMKLDFEDNNLDSFRTSSFSPMLKFSKGSSSNYGKLKCENNNFLTSTPGFHKVEIYGNNPNLSTFDLLNFRHNYWGTTDTLKIDSFIEDYNDEIKIYGKADYSGFYSHAHEPICKKKSTCKADFYLGIDSTEDFVIYVITKNTGVTPGTKYTWDFGDGHTSNKKHTSHFYDSFGKYTLCLTIEDSIHGCYDKICKTIGMDSFGHWLMVRGFTVNIISESQFLSIKNAEKHLDFTVFPNPSKEKVSVLVPNARASQYQIELTTLEGRVLDYKTTDSNRTSFDVSHIPNGVYLIKVKSTLQSGVSKIVVLN